MKTKVLVVSSLALNVALAAAWFLKPGVSSTEWTDSVSKASAEARASALKQASLEKDEALKGAILTKENWAHLWSDDPKTLIKNLQAAGVPERYIRALVSTAISQRYAAQFKEIFNTGDVPYWKAKNPYFSVYSDKEKGPKLRALNRQVSDSVKDALSDLPRDPDDETASYLKYQYGNLSKDKIEALQRVQQDYSDMRSSFTEQYGQFGNIFPEDREKRALLDKEEKADIAAILTPAELREYEMRTSMTANSMKNSLALFNANEQEFNAIYDAKKAYDDKYSYAVVGGGPLSEAQQKERMAAQKAVDEQIKAALGDARYADYQKSTDQTYQLASKITEHYGLPAENAAAVYDLKASVDKQMAAINSNKDNTPELRAAAYQNLSADINAKLNQYLGEKGVAAMKQSYAAYWLQNIDRMAKMPTRVQRSSN